MELTAEAAIKLCKKHSLYLTPHLNDKFYCNFEGLTSLTGLADYTQLKSLFAEGNCIGDLDSLPALLNLRCL